MRYTLLLLLSFFTATAFSQTSTVQDKLMQVSFESVTTPQHPKRKLLRSKKKLAQYNPVTYVSAGLLYVYQNIFSEQIQAECTYRISCSEYTKLSIQQSGFIIGVLSGFNQLSECFNGAVYEHPRSFINNNHKIINSIGNESN